MAIESEADRLALFDDFDSASYTPDGGSLSTITGVFDAEYLGVELERFGIDNAMPIFLTSAAQVTGVAAGDALTVGGTDYTITGAEPDGTGMVLLVLEL
jgi:hypothetical protein